ncbi:MAG: helix-turn-helix domain-containing protein [Candidatus Eisenbacteria bacterium]
MEILAKPWNGLIIAALESGPLRFSDLQVRLMGIGDRMLSMRLKELATRGLVVRRVLKGPPVGVEYELTDAGMGFGGVMEAVSRWGESLPGGKRARQPARPGSRHGTRTN